MAKFERKGKTGMPAISTASLPDIVFMLLFFFMVSTTLRETELFVKIKLPEASEVVKLEKKSLVSYIYIGPPARQYQSLFGTDSRIQLNDSFKTLTDIRDFISSEREAMSESDRPFLQTSLKIDEDTRMGIVTDVKQELRKASALKISYSARRVIHD
ncbi:MAG: biopolymer transporter ExbD [Tenuifilaceae bacterium]|jgi:biopolymer transport protein ExbD|nr:biopolymer transporter ExbD [Bacteroidales bacterium]MDI9515850.1 biopolymer transporter ExbD [Bacteroidota bacterium]NLH56751.1 biopolymer transporter ExbD [Rikenellaceae bacterium]OQC62115.1 MAG: Biopolymer transport protein ExbD/TolR [Bacteroidetes bacterium ADurb.Bin008]HNV81545.1 biopolymer transporter ExbD [Tenuifilaceae bacterium]